MGGDSYLSGRHALQAYLDPAVLAAAGIRLAFQEWQAPVYQQLYPAAGFVPDLAILDLLFNEGPRAKEILLASGAVTYPERGELTTGAGFPLCSARTKRRREAWIQPWANRW